MMLQQDGTPVGEVSATKLKRLRSKRNRSKSRPVHISNPWALGTHIETALTSVGITSERVSRWLGKPCGCKERKDKLNQLGAWAHRVITGKEDDHKQRLETIVGISLESVNQVVADQPMKIMTWAYAIITTPSRFGELLPRTITSLAIAGFDDPWLFIDGCKEADIPDRYSNFSCVCRSPCIRTAGHWTLTLWELYLRNPNADRYAIFQDDLVTYPNLREYLEKSEYPEKGYCNLYTFPHNQKLAPENVPAWYISNQRGLGAVATVFSNEAAMTLLRADHMTNRVKCPKKGHRAIDGGIVDSMKKAGWKEYVHNPSLVQHTGHISSMDNGKHPQAISFRGENFDALELLK